MKTFFREVSADKPLQEMVEEVSAGRAGAAAKAKLDEEARRVSAELPAKLIEAIKGLKSEKSAFAGHLQPVHVEIVDYMLANHETPIKNAVPVLVKRSMEEKRVRAKDDSGATVHKSEWEFNRSRLEHNLEEFLFGQTGIYFDVEFALEDVPGGSLVRGKKRIQLATPFRTLRAASIHLPYIGGTATLWDKVIENTWIKNYPTLLPPSKFKNIKKLSDAKAQYKSAARIVLRALGPSPAVFHSKEFRFTDITAKLVEEEVFPVLGGQLPASKLPPWKEYAKDERTSRNWDASLGYAALRLGTYGQGEKGGEQYGAERDAHHLTQYLLLEYFRNVKTGYKPFRHALSNYTPGVQGSGGLVSSIVKPDGSRRINIKDYENKRGLLMPTILVSKHAHVYGGLHVSPKADDAHDKKSSPGFAVHDQFRQGLGDLYAGIMFEASPKKLQTVKRQTKGESGPESGRVTDGGVPVTSEMLQEAMYTAACKTYTWMRRQMLESKLLRGLQTEEVTYYERKVTLIEDKSVFDAERKYVHPDYRADPGKLVGVVTAATTHHDSIMEAPDKAGFERL